MSLMAAAAFENAAEAEARFKKASEQAWAWKREAERLQGMMTGLQQQAVVDQATIAGLNAQLQALAEAHPQNPLLQPSGKVYQNGPRKGRPKSKARMVFEAAFDAALKKLNISNPLAHRDY